MSVSMPGDSPPVVRVWPTGWNTALRRPPRILVYQRDLSLACRRTICATPAALSIKTRSYPFRATWVPFALPQEQVDRTRQATPVGRDRSSPTIHRPSPVRPPGDVVKLEDRLYYLLQPPLASLLARSDLPIPASPFPFQYEGIGFLYTRHAAILADEMGLGKTVQTILALRLLLHAGEIESVLLICPKPLVRTWASELDRWAPETPLCLVEGDPERRAWQWSAAPAPIKIANYELLLRDERLVTEPNVRFDVVVLDEAQRIKNRHSRSSRIVRSLNRRRSWALTGTPVENSPEDLVGIFEFIAPGYLTPGIPPRRMRQAARDFILRRTKTQVLSELPPKLFRDELLELTVEQRITYEMAESDGVLRLNRLGHALTIQHVFELILRLKQICNFDPATGASSKLLRLLAGLEEVAESGQKALVFSQWVDTLQQLSLRLTRYRPLCYHGRVPHRQRQQVLDRFRNDPRCHVLLMSYGAGSVGLNLQFASYVFLFDRWWNPAVEDQAINRAHRIGSASPVTITRFVTASTIEERIDEVLRQKRELFDILLAGVPGTTALTQDEVFGLFSLHVHSHDRAGQGAAAA